LCTDTKAPTKAQTKATETSTSKPVVKPTAKPVTNESIPKPVAEPTAKPTTFSLSKTNVSILLTELGDRHPSDYALLHSGKKLPTTVRKKQAPPTKKLNFAETALAAMESEDQEQGDAGSKNEVDLFEGVEMLSHDCR
jgi:hypothetical protein